MADPTPPAAPTAAPPAAAKPVAAQAPAQAPVVKPDAAPQNQQVNQQVNRPRAAITNVAPDDEPVVEEKPRLPAATIAEMEAGRAALERKR